MAIEDYIPNVFGGAPTMYQGLLNPKDQAALERRANLGGLLVHKAIVGLHYRTS
jgi:hypothetical protein